VQQCAEPVLEPDLVGEVGQTCQARANRPTTRAARFVTRARLILMLHRTYFGCSQARQHPYQGAEGHGVDPQKQPTTKAVLWS